MLIVVVGILFISMIGTISHFLYDLTNHNRIMALFVAVNESIWEHIKIALTPTFLWSIVLLFMYGSYPNFWLSQLLSAVTILFLIPLLFFGYKIIAKRSILAIDVTIFYIAIIVSQIIGYYILNLPEAFKLVEYLSIIFFFVIFSIYLLGTIMPPNNKIFVDPITNKKGIEGHSKKFCLAKKKK